MQLRDILRAAILSGEFTGKLPSARTIGQEQDGMAVNTVTKALVALREEGLVTARAGWGWSVVPAAGRARPAAGQAG
jgi:DNA-binding GntR family transcriptional regulator